MIFHSCITYVQLETNPGFAGKVPPKASVTRIPKQGHAFQTEKPVWKVGFKWEYEWERPDSSGTLTRRILRTETFENVPCYVLKIRRSESFYTRDVLGLLATKTRGKVTVKRDAPFQPLAWPLYVGRSWKNVFTMERPQDESSSNFDNEVVVAKFEEVVVPAGKFKAFKIDVYRSFDGELMSEYWYSPQVKWFVKKISYKGRGSRPREERLISYSVD